MSPRSQHEPKACRPPFRLAFALVVMATSCHVSKGQHGSRLVEPPARSSLWRYGFGTPVDFQDDHVNCGGFDRQHGQNGGRCGVCGDPWDEPPPRKYEAGNVTTLNPRPVRVYHMGGDIPVVIDSAAYLLGQYEFRLCQLNSSEDTPDQSCFDASPLPIRESDLGLNYRIGQAGGLVSLHLVLPENFTCLHCILQWRHVTGNRMNKDTCVQCGSQLQCTYCQGCGQQAWFQSCADIAIYNVAGTHPASRGTLTSEQVRQQWEQTLSDLKAKCPCSSSSSSSTSTSLTPTSGSENGVVYSELPAPRRYLQLPDMPAGHVRASHFRRKRMEAEQPHVLATSFDVSRAV
ncbi:uncharacterized protein LOC143277782 [Babylonia areolata]|uniref:uncharacterized protein LOC143277782 n=1 Tax=Babylonia areolata TaxID=304850 RepID=UPI003FD49A67